MDPTKETMNISSFHVKSHSIDFMAAESSSSTVRLATGCGVDVRIWRGDKHRMFGPVLLQMLLTIHTYLSDDWEGQGFLGCPKKSADNCGAEVILTGLHWCRTPNTDGIRLITAYRHHGIQCVLLCHQPLKS